jgi:hypothetical protein
MVPFGGNQHALEQTKRPETRNPYVAVGSNATGPADPTLPLDVRFTPKATEFVRTAKGRELQVRTCAIYSIT